MYNILYHESAMLVKWYHMWNTLVRACGLLAVNKTLESLNPSYALLTYADRHTSSWWLLPWRQIHVWHLQPAYSFDCAYCVTWTYQVTWLLRYNYCSKEVGRPSIHQFICYGWVLVIKIITLFVPLHLRQNCACWWSSLLGAKDIFTVGSLNADILRHNADNLSITLKLWGELDENVSWVNTFPSHSSISLHFTR